MDENAQEEVLGGKGEKAGEEERYGVQQGLNEILRPDRVDSCMRDSLFGSSVFTVWSVR